MGRKGEPPVILVCKTCGKEFQVYASVLKYQNKLYCSRECRYGKTVDKTGVPEGFKKCWRCEQVFSLNRDNFQWSVLKGFSPYCRACRNQWQNERRRANPEKELERGKQYRENNREKVRESSRRYNEQNREKRREQWRRYDAARKEQKRQYQSGRKPQNQQAKEKYRSKPGVREKERETGRLYRLKNLFLIRFKARKRNHQRRAAEGHYTKADIDRKYQTQKGKCYYCGIKMGKTEFTIDHVIPITRGGSNWPDNIVLACAACNGHKNAKLPHEWPKGGRLL